MDKVFLVGAIIEGLIGAGSFLFAIIGTILISPMWLIMILPACMAGFIVWTMIKDGKID
jgi:hypothetical protein